MKRVCPTEAAVRSKTGTTCNRCTYIVHGKRGRAHAASWVSLGDGLRVEGSRGFRSWPTSRANNCPVSQCPSGPPSAGTGSLSWYNRWVHIISTRLWSVLSRFLQRRELVLAGRAGLIGSWSVADGRDSPPTWFGSYKFLAGRDCRGR